MANKRKKYSAEEKVRLLRLHLIEKDLAIEGEKKEESQSKENGYHHVERS